MAGTPPIPLLTGLDLARGREFVQFQGKRVGLVTHPAAVSRGQIDLIAGGWSGGLHSSVELFATTPGVTLAALFGPEHGLTAEAQDLEGVAGSPLHPRYKVPVHSLYGDTFASLAPTPEQLAGLDVLAIDLQDVGSRYYTFQATMLYCLEAAAKVGLTVAILDRPNPVGGLAVEGPALRPGFESFVGPHPVATRHGLTMCELARLYMLEREIGVNIQAVPCHGLKRGMAWADTPLPWLPPSPNMPTPDTALVYPGMCLIEGTNLSEGRGTTRPFEYVGFPGADPHAVADRLAADPPPGVEFVPVTFRPTFQKHAGQTCGGVFLVVSDQQAFRPVRTGLAVLCAFKAVLGDAFRWRTERYEFVDDKPAIDILFGSDRERLAIDAGTPWREIAAAWESEEAEFADRRKKAFVYPE
jgi:uncharacterized protein YbbC (DUF1343 family)